MGLRDVTRVEVKSSAISFDRSGNRWYYVFRNVDERCFDELRLVFYNPRGVYVFVHDGESGWANNGKVTAVTGKKNIKVFGPRNVLDWESAWSAMLKKDFGSLII